MTQYKYQEKQKLFVCSLLYTGTVTCDHGDPGADQDSVQKQGLFTQSCRTGEIVGSELWGC